MRVLFDPGGWEQFLHWRAADPGIANTIERLVEECRRTPFTGTGRPEPLRGDLSGFWSRRITQEHRLIYRVSGKGAEQTLEILSCRFHYSKR